MRPKPLPNFKRVALAASGLLMASGDGVRSLVHAAHRDEARIDIPGLCTYLPSLAGILQGVACTLMLAAIEFQRRATRCKRGPARLSR